MQPTLYSTVFQVESAEDCLVCMRASAKWNGTLAQCWPLLAPIIPSVHKLTLLQSVDYGRFALAISIFHNYPELPSAPCTDHRAKLAAIVWRPLMAQMCLYLVSQHRMFNLWPPIYLRANRGPIWGATLIGSPPSQTNFLSLPKPVIR